MTIGTKPCDWCGKQTLNWDPKTSYSEQVVTCDRCEKGHWMCSVETEKLK